MKTIFCLPLVFAACVMSCGEGGKQSPAPFTKTLALPGLPKFEYPSQYEISPESGKGESKWTVILKGQEGDPLIEASGFFHIPDSERRDGEASLASLKRMSAKAAPSETSPVVTMLNDHILRVTSVGRDEIETVLWLVPFEGANGAAIKSLRMKYRPGREKLVEQVVQSWIEGVKLLERDN